MRAQDEMRSPIARECAAANLWISVGRMVTPPLLSRHIPYIISIYYQYIYIYTKVYIPVYWYIRCSTSIDMYWSIYLDSFSIPTTQYFPIAIFYHCLSIRGQASDRSCLQLICSQQNTDHSCSSAYFSSYFAGISVYVTLSTYCLQLGLRE